MANQQPQTKTKDTVKPRKVTGKQKEGYWSKLDRTEIRRIKFYIYIIEIILGIVIILGAMYESIIVEPFYFPVGYLLLFILFFAFLISVEGVWFKFIMIKTAKSYKKRSKLIKDYRYRAQSALVASIVIIILLLSFSFLPFVSDAMRTEDSFKLSNFDTEKSTSFEDQDILGLTHTNEITFDSNNTLELKLRVRQLSRDLDASEIEEKDIGNKTDLDYPLDSPDYQLGYSKNKEYHFFIINVGNNNVSGNYTINREISKPFILNVLLFMILFIITSVVWLAYLNIIKKKYKELHDEKVAELTKRYAVKPYTIEDVFLIYMNGTLLTHQTRRLKPMDNDILSGMLTAIKDFVRDVFKADAKGQLNELTFGKLKILIESGQYAFLAVVVSGTPPKDLKTRMKRTITQINTQFHNQLKNYQGDAKPLAPVKSIIGQQLLGTEDSATEMDQDSDSAWNNKGVILTKMGKYNEAIESFDKALRINPGVSNIWLNRGIALVKLNEFEEALDCFDRALQLDPGNEAAKRRRNKCWYKWKLMEAREGRMISGGTRGTGRVAEDAQYDYDYDYERPAPRHEVISTSGTAPSPHAKTSADYYRDPGYSGYSAEEPPPRCPNCGQPLEFIEEYESWYCPPCDSYPFDD
ncbi:tetratricopeptide repeat protein [[Eubacterium] cellulosolvens]